MTRIDRDEARGILIGSGLLLLGVLAVLALAQAAGGLAQGEPRCAVERVDLSGSARGGSGALVKALAAQCR
jgi:hypothetical protein